MEARTIKRAFIGLLAAAGVLLSLGALFLLSVTAQNSEQFDRLHNVLVAVNIAGAVLLLVLLTLFFNDRLERQRNPNMQVMTSTTAGGAPAVRLERNRYGHYVASGFINGRPVEFMLDTGASDVSIPLSVAEEIGLQKGRPVTYQTANGTIRAWQTVVDEIRLGELGVGPVRASINPRLGIEGLVRTMYDGRNNLATAVSDELIANFGDRVYRTLVPRNVRVAEAPSYGLPVLVYDPRSKGALAHVALAGEMLRRHEKRHIA